MQLLALHAALQEDEVQWFKERISNSDSTLMSEEWNKLIESPYASPGPDEELEQILEGEPVKSTGPEKTSAQSLENSSPDFTWRDIRIVFETGSSMCLEIAGRPSQRKTFEGSGFLNKKTGGKLKQ